MDLDLPILHCRVANSIFSVAETYALIPSPQFSIASSTFSIVALPILI